MNKFKKILGLILAFSLCICCIASFASCNEEPGEQTPGDSEDDEPKDESVTYTVTVKDRSGNAVKGAVCFFTINGSETDDITTDDNGNASYKNSKAAMIAMVTIASVPEGYILPEADTITYAEGQTDATVTVDSQTKYTVSVKDSAGVGVSGVYIQLCFDFCLAPKNTDGEGCSVFYSNSDITPYVTMKLDGVAYSYDEESYNPEKGGYVIYFEEGKTELIITLISN